MNSWFFKFHESISGCVHDSWHNCTQHQDSGWNCQDGLYQDSSVLRWRQEQRHWHFVCQGNKKIMPYNLLIPFLHKWLIWKLCVPFYMHLFLFNVIPFKDLALLDPDDNFTVKTVCGYHKHPVKFVFNDTPLSILLEAFKKVSTGHALWAQVRSMLGISSKVVHWLDGLFPGRGPFGNGEKALLWCRRSRSHLWISGCGHSWRYCRGNSAG